ncbi:hypothetical protein FRX31_016142 [Thalictrum thalictroides]|uniref:Uncharacterized protein n=1 Tax=Thalictrum thalictroides TaxID=46969 RepID=A0A7J6WAE0_THATH|nr:hypothetical protein FRX31_016142 [Thalictrum thalictroides]
MAEPNCPWSQAKMTSQPATGNQSQVGQGKKTLNLKSASGKQSQVEQGKKTFKSASNNQSQLQMVKFVGSQSSDNREIVQSLKAAPNCPWRQGSKWPSTGKKQAFVRN